MDAEKIVKMCPDVIHEMVESVQVATHGKVMSDKRSTERWPFPGTCELWLPDECYGEQHLLATLHNLSNSGLAMRTRRPIPSNTAITIAIHLPHLSAHGRAIVRHCTRAPYGYLVGVEFTFRDEEEE